MSETVPLMSLSDVYVVVVRLSVVATIAAALVYVALRWDFLLHRFERWERSRRDLVSARRHVASLADRVVVDHRRLAGTVQNPSDPSPVARRSLDKLR